MTAVRWIGMAYGAAVLMLAALFYLHLNYGTIAKASSGDVAADIRLRMLVLEEIASTIGVTMLFGLPVIVGVFIWRRAWARIEARKAIDDRTEPHTGAVDESLRTP